MVLRTIKEGLHVDAFWKLEIPDLRQLEDELQKYIQVQLLLGELLYIV